MEIGLNIRHHNGADWASIRDGVKLAEHVGFSVVCFPDHYFPNERIIAGARPTSGTASSASPNRGPTWTDDETAADIASPTGPSDCWTLIASLVPQTANIRFATMMTSATFRMPGPLAVAVAQINRFSEGRVDMGIGANWHEGEHSAFAIPYPSRRTRFDLLEEYLAVVCRLWDSPAAERFDFDGTFFALRGGSGIPRPERIDRPRIIIGGSGLTRTPRIAGRFADECNTLAKTPKLAERFFAACARQFELAGRDPAGMRRSHLLNTVCAVDEADLRRQVRAAGLDGPEQLQPGRVSSPAQLIDRLQAWEAAGLDRVVLTGIGSVDLQSIEMLGELVVPEFS
jgi:alkanesulfonate monooxygenase SsuD/methylene tetrahydromethanopterin reductase-like flavin-dependent oxidoreductase (luciferase family)